MVQCQSRQKVRKTPISTNKPGMVVHNRNLSYVGGIGRRIVVQAHPWARNSRPYLKNNLK
jgi:hypothetical protein